DPGCADVCQSLAVECHTRAGAAPVRQRAPGPATDSTDAGGRPARRCLPSALACRENQQGEVTVPVHPLVQETVRDCLTEAMDVDGLTALLRRIERGEIRCLAVDTPAPSPFCHEILNANPYAYLDDAPLEERRARAVEMRRSLPPELAGNLGALDPFAIAEVAE